MKPYISSKKYSENESKKEFAERIKKEPKEKQLIPVNFRGKKYAVIFSPSGFITTSFGRFQVIPSKVLFGKWGWHYVLIYPGIEKLPDNQKIVLRLDSGCYSGMVFDDIVCDCREQLKIAQKLCVQNNGGIIIHMPEHDGRGYKSLKWAEKRLIDELEMGVAEAAKLFHGKEEMTDIRTFDEAAIILRALGLENHTFEIATNNPKKIRAMKSAGIKLESAKSVLVKNPNNFVKNNLKSKKKIWKHNFQN